MPGGAQIISQNGSVENDIKTALANGFKALGQQLNSVVENAVNVVNEYSAKVNYRLEGISNDWNKIYDMTKKNLGISALAK